MNKQPAHIAFIPDGNRRWAKEKGLPSIEGHRVGYNRFKENQSMYGFIKVVGNPVERNY